VHAQLLQRLDGLRDGGEDREGDVLDEDLLRGGRAALHAILDDLRDRRSIATTARALYIHANTLRQRLERIENVTGLDLAAEDLLSLELAIKLVRLRDG
jgi:hypothetical protein